MNKVEKEVRAHPYFQSIKKPDSTGCVFVVYWRDPSDLDHNKKPTLKAAWSYDRSAAFEEAQQQILTAMVMR